LILTNYWPHAIIGSDKVKNESVDKLIGIGTKMYATIAAITSMILFLMFSV